ncbi:hypothetical protein JKG47_18125 [Acidithiobacillus sp. MC6.1]|nr:hypothetical protein [Acidithiobacillus sp. MC6.1]
MRKHLAILPFLGIGIAALLSGCNQATGTASAAPFLKAGQVYCDSPGYGNGKSIKVLAASGDFVKMEPTTGNQKVGPVWVNIREIQSLTDGPCKG